MESQEAPLQKIESAETKIESLLQKIEAESERMDDFAIRNLNPFTDTQTLERFAEKNEFGKGTVIEFKRPKGFGEEIQGKFIGQFFEKYFPSAEINRLDDNQNSSSEKNIIKVDMLDYAEDRNGALNSGRNYHDPALDSKGVTLFSMIQTKLIHNIHVPEPYVTELKNQILQAVPDQSGIDNATKTVPWIVGEIHPWSLVHDGEYGIKESFQYIHTARNITSYSYDGEKGIVTQIAEIPLKGKRLRFLYSLGNFSTIKYNRNKVEGLTNNARVITLEDDYLSPRHNSNYNLDKLLHERGLIKTKKEIHESGGLQNYTSRTTLSDTVKQEIYDELIDPNKKIIYEPTLKESMNQVVKGINTIKTKRLWRKWF